MSNVGFKFNFQLQNDDAVEGSGSNNFTEVDIKEQQCEVTFCIPGNCVAAPASELFIQPFHHDLVGKYNYATLECDNASLQLKYASLEDIRQQINAFKMPDKADKHKPNSCSALLEAIAINSDLIPGVYEGGLKIWEGSCDLLEYLCTGKIELNGTRVLELGCGAGLPGIVALLHGASCVTFQDYNPGVINLFTIPNILANVTAQPTPSMKFFAGDWSDLMALINPSDEPSMKYDIVLTSETVYCVDSQPKLLQLIKKHVKPCTGRALVAGKSHYFGVGGSMEMFKTLVSNDGFFKCSSCMTVTQCSVLREVILLEQP